MQRGSHGINRILAGDLLYLAKVQKVSVRVLIYEVLETYVAERRFEAVKIAKSSRLQVLQLKDLIDSVLTEIQSIGE